MHLKANQAPGEIFLERWPRVNAVVKRILNMEDVPLTDWHGMFEYVHLGFFVLSISQRCLPDYRLGV